MLSVILPAYNEAQMIDAAMRRIHEILKEAKIPYEIIFVNDGSTDGTKEEIEKAANLNSRVRGLCFSRNFGKEAAIYAGLADAAGDCAVVLDCDLQHPPEKIVDMYRLWQDGYDVIEGVKKSRGKESKGHAFAVKGFYKMISKATGVDMENASDFKLLDRKAIDTLINIPEKNMFFRAMSSWIGFKTISVEYDVAERTAGTTKWSTKSLFRYALSNITSFTTAPMELVTILGVITFVTGLILSVVALVQKIRGVALGGFTTVIILLCIFSSIIMISLGIIGFYIAKIYDEVKGRPRYIISEIIERKK